MYIIFVLYYSNTDVQMYQHLQSPPHILQTGLFSQSVFPQQNPIALVESKKLWQETAEVQTDSVAYPAWQKENAILSYAYLTIILCARVGYNHLLLKTGSLYNAIQGIWLA